MRIHSPWVIALIAGVLAVPVVLAQRGAGRGAGGQAPAAAPATPGTVDTGPYQLVPNWPQPLPDNRHPHAGWTWGSVGAVYAETPDRIWIAQRGELPLPDGAKPWTSYGMLTPPRQANSNTDGVTATCGKSENLRGWERRWEHVIFVVDRNGKLIQEWPQYDKIWGLAPCGRGPHHIKINQHDPQKRVWVIDDQLHVIYRFTSTGVMDKTLGEIGIRGRGPNTFDRPTDIDWFPDGTYFISDGYGGKRVAKFDKNDKFLMDWGQAPVDTAKPGPNEFNTVHGIAVSKDRRVFVSDRGHSRIQVFDENGKFLNMWSTGQGSQPYDIIVTDDQFLWMVDGGQTQRVVKYDLSGKQLFEWGSRGALPGQFNGPHQLTVDQGGNLYIAEVFGGRVQKFAPRPGANPAQLVGQEVRVK